MIDRPVLAAVAAISIKIRSVLTPITSIHISVKILTSIGSRSPSHKVWSISVSISHRHPNPPVVKVIISMIIRTKISVTRRSIFRVSFFPGQSIRPSEILRRSHNRWHST